jgi:hypothetical protein
MSIGAILVHVPKRQDEAGSEQPKRCDRETARQRNIFLVVRGDEIKRHACADEIQNCQRCEQPAERA